MDDWTFLQTDRAIAAEGAARGLSSSAIAAIMLGQPSDLPPPRLHPACPRGGQVYWQREFLAGGPTFAALARSELVLPHPLDGALCRANACSGVGGVAGHSVAPLIYRLGEGPRVFYAVAGSLAPRITLIILPSLKIVVHELSDAPARALLLHLETPALGDGMLSIEGLVIGVNEMVTNHGHHMLNHLAGLQRVVDAGLANKLDEVWTSGRTFFGDTGDLFPEFAGRLRHFLSHQALRDALGTEPGLKLRIGSTHFSSSLRARILRRAGVSQRAPRGAGPLLHFTLRGGSRRCLNLHDCVKAIVDEALARWRQTRVILDGWTTAHWHEPSASPIRHFLADPSRKAIDTELDEAGMLATRLPRGVLLRSVNGVPMLDSIALCRNVDAYFAHTGTLQHKIGFLSDAVGVVHGPTATLTSPEAGAYMHDGPHAPVPLPPDLVEDVPDSGGLRGPTSNDYRITDPRRAAVFFCDTIATHVANPSQ